jgi:NAD-dependent SIR2 family protein deacetylase
VVFFGDNVPKERADKVMKGARECDAFLVLGSSLMTMSAFRLARCTSHFIACNIQVIFPASLNYIPYDA